MSDAATADGSGENGAKTKKRSTVRGKIMFYTLIIIALVLGALWLFGPREPVVTDVSFDPAVLGDDVEAWVIERDADVAGVRPETAREIVWAFPASKARTPIALAYLHGFSASKGEIRPAPDQAAAALDANLYFGRLTGHGTTGPAMALATVEDWVNDTAEAIYIAERLGEKVVLISTSTGGTLAAIAAFHPDLRDRIDGIVFISPNFAIKAPGSSLLTMPFAETIVPLLVGAERSFEPVNEAHGQLWTARYPSQALLPMAAAVRHASTLPYAQTDIPALFIFSDDDQVVDAETTRAVASRWGGPSEMMVIEETDDPYNHVLAGDVLSPSTTDAVAGRITDWIKAL